MVRIFGAKNKKFVVLVIGKVDIENLTIGGLRGAASFVKAAFCLYRSTKKAS